MAERDWADEEAEKAIRDVDGDAHVLGFYVVNTNHVAPEFMIREMRGHYADALRTAHRHGMLRAAEIADHNAEVWRGVARIDGVSTDTQQYVADEIARAIREEAGEDK